MSGVLTALLCGQALAATYVVKPGDTLYSLARSVGLTVAQLQALNQLTGTDLKVGQTLELPAGPAQPPAPPAPTETLPPPMPGTARPAVQVSRPGCCANVQWTADSTQLIVLDRPAGGEPGLYRIPADGSAPAGFLDLSPALLSPDGAFALQPRSASSATAVRFSDGARAAVPTSGRDAAWSPQGALAWSTYGTADRDDWIPLTVFVADPFVNGSVAAPRRLPTVYGGRLVGWLNGTTVLLTGRLTRTDPRRSLVSVNIQGGPPQVLAEGQMFSGVRVSPDGSRVVYRVTLDMPGRNGMFVVGTEDRRVTPLPLFGSARWQDPGHLLMVPFEPGQPSQRLVQLDVESGEVRPLLTLQDRIAHDDWQVAPDGLRVAYLSQTSRALLVLPLPPTLPPIPIPADPGPAPEAP
ncbi:LysM peptidoglycan-binding domain-containing protein [Deinococcus sonorensis]|uniref:LysM peptidoglycan-binding domain-containing protein n=2 Tax=Deinococcus sonorensis TaxID=309891 RepID=A0AAU7UA73_9DEIO